MPTARRNSTSPSTGFILLIAALMGINALAVDVMLPALHEIGESLNIADGNQLQWVVAIYMIGFGATQFLFGPMADSFGRRRVLFFGLIGYLSMAAVSAFSSSFFLLLTARCLQGAAASAVRVTALAIVRDRYSGSAMSKVMSLSMMVFLAIPVFAPMLGQGILYFGNWREIFGLLVIYSGVTLIWAYLRVKESLPADKRKPFTLAETFQSFKFVLTHMESLAYTIATGLGMAMLMAYVFSGAQIFASYGVGDLFPYLFGIGASGFAVAALVNSRFVERLGPAQLVERALVGLCAVAAINLLILNLTEYSLYLFIVMQFIIVFFIGLITPNLQAMAMDAMENVAGTASSVQGTVMTLVAAIAGVLIAQAFDGTVRPIVVGYLLCAFAQAGLIHLTWRRKRKKKTAET